MESLESRAELYKFNKNFILAVRSFDTDRYCTIIYAAFYHVDVLHLGMKVLTLWRIWRLIVTWSSCSLVPVYGLYCGRSVRTGMTGS